ncbi:MAG: preprotein translocase subunit YajC [Bacteroidales bacterium]|nr:preprotein translocase subunit YajC [Bacteroidales bacterium]
MNTLFAMLQAPAAAPETGTEDHTTSMMPTLIMMVVLFAIIYFFMIRPQNKKQKEIQKFRNSLQVGQDIVTIGGIHGTIRSIDEASNTVMLEVATGVKIKFERSAILPAGSPVQQQ